MTVRYRIRPEAVWADGVPISGDDFRFTLETVAGTSGVVVPWQGTQEIYQDVIAGSVVAGPKTFEFRLPRPSLAHTGMFAVLIPEHDVAGSDFLGDWNREPWVAGGPFRYESWPRGGDRLTLIRNERYWKTDPATGRRLPYLDRVTFRFLPEIEEFVDAFAARALDVIEPPPGAVAGLRELAAEGAEIQVRPGPVWEHLAFQFGPDNRNPGSLNRHLEYRRAVAHALDREALVAAAVAPGTPAMGSFVEAFLPGLSGGAWAAYVHDPAEARELIAGLCRRLERDCAAEPPRLVVSASENRAERVRIADALTPMLAEAGIEVEVHLDSLDIGETIAAGAWDGALWAWPAAPGLAPVIRFLDVFDPEAPPPDGRNFYRWGTPAVTGSLLYDQGPSTVVDEHSRRLAALLEETRATVDERRLAALLREAEQILADQVVMIPLYAWPDAGAVWADEVGGYVHNPTGATDLWNLESWHRRDS